MGAHAPLVLGVASPLAAVTDSIPRLSSPMSPITGIELTFHKGFVRAPVNFLQKLEQIGGYDLYYKMLEMKTKRVA